MTINRADWLRDARALLTEDHKERSRKPAYRPLTSENRQNGPAKPRFRSGRPGSRFLLPGRGWR
jgi:hypothetical protein